MTEEEKKAAEAAAEATRKEEYTAIANSAASSHVKRQAKQVNDQLAIIMAKLEELSAAPPAPAAPEGESNAEDDKVKALQARLKDMDNAVAQREQQLADQEQQRRTSAARNMLKDSLAESGVPADRLKQAVGYLFDAEQRVQYAENGDVEFLIPESGYTDRLDISSGVKKFLDSSEGKMYLPARDVAGSGNQGGNAPRARPSAPQGGDQELEDMSHADLLSELGKAMIAGS